MPLPSSNLVPFGRWWHARGRGHCGGKPGRAPQHAQAYYYCMYYWVGKHQIWRGRRLSRSATSQGSAEPLCARIKGQARTGRFLAGKLISVHGLLCFLRRLTGRYERAILLGRFPGTHRALDGWMVAGPPASPAQDLHRRHGSWYYSFLHELWVRLFLHEMLIRETLTY